MKKILLILLTCVFPFLAWAVEYAPIANLEYIHRAIADKYDITVSYNPAVVDISAAANMKYLLTAIDVANQIQGNQTNYGTGEFATEYAANTITVDTAIATLIKGAVDSDEPDFSVPDPSEPGYELLEAPYKFALKTNATNSFSFDIAATGAFIVDWGDGTVETFEQTSTNSTTYSHTYATSQPQTIRIGGQATGYNSATDIASISFASRSVISEIFGSLGLVFPTLADGAQPRFYRTFYYNFNLGGIIPRRLFYGVKGAPVSYMFYQTFYNCDGLTSVPEGLFGWLDGAPASSMFYQTFYNCSSLTKIPDNLFGNIYGQPAMYMFYGTFYNCTGLTGEIPLGLFGDLDNYYRSYMFGYTFYNCSGLTGPSARMPDGTYLYNYFTTGSGYYQMSKTYSGCTQLSDYANIPTGSK